MRQYISPMLVMFTLSLAGVLFSGYLSAVKLFTDTCAFNETCPYFLGYPSCWYGFALFLALFTISSLSILGVVSIYSMEILFVIISGVGTLFSGYFAIPEILQELSGVAVSHTLGLPTCVYGFIFFVLIFILSGRRFAQ